MHHCDYIITNNTKDFAKSHIKAMSPWEFVVLETVKDLVGNC
jgi:hypothetical protein